MITSDFINLVRDFEAGELNLGRLNYAIITLVPKEVEAKHLKKFKPTSLINCSFKVFAKALNNRLIKLSDRPICPNQTTFIRGGLFSKVWLLPIKLFMTYIEIRRV